MRRMNQIIFWTESPFAERAQPGQEDVGEYRRAIVYYKLLKDVFPNSARPYEMIGFCQYLIGNKDKSIFWYKKALERQPEFFWIQYSIAAIYFQLGRYQEAVEHGQEALRYSNKIMEEISILGDLQRLEESKRAGFYNLARSFAREIRLNTQKLLLVSYDQLGDHARMQFVAQMALQENPVLPQVFFNYYLALAREKVRPGPNAAVESFRKTFKEQKLDFAPRYHPWAKYIPVEQERLLSRESGLQRLKKAVKE